MVMNLTKKRIDFESIPYEDCAMIAQEIINQVHAEGIPDDIAAEALFKIADALYEAAEVLGGLHDPDLGETIH